MFYVYQHIRKDNNIPFYVGKGSKNRVNFKGRKNKGWNNIVNKVGYKPEILKYFSNEDEAIEWEHQLIKEYGQQGIKLVNQTKYSKGGTSYSYTQEVRKKQSLGQMGTKRPKSKEWCAKISRANSGRNITWASKIGDALRGVPKNYPNPNKKTIIQYSLEHQYIKEYESAAQAGNTINKSGNSIADAAAGRQKTAYGFIWKYKK